MKVVFADKTRSVVWEKWFAWYPVLVESAGGPNFWCWLEYVERKNYYGYGGWQKRYREIA